MGLPGTALHPPRDAVSKRVGAMLRHAAISAPPRIPRRDRSRDRRRHPVAEGGRGFLLLIRSKYEKSIHHFTADDGFPCSALRGTGRRAAISQGADGEGDGGQRTDGERG